MTNFIVTDRSPARFRGDFELRETSPGDSLALAEQEYLAKLESVLDALAEDETEDTTADMPAISALVEARRKGRGLTASELRAEAEEFCKGQLAPEIARDNVLVLKGKYAAENEKLSSALFVVEEKLEGQFVVDILISVSRDLPAPNNKPSDDQSALFVALNGASTVIKTVSQRMFTRAQKSYFDQFKKVEQERSRRLLNQYMKKLVGIGRLGLQGPHTQLAKLALEGLRAEFVAQEAGRVKNTYVRSLGLAAGVFAIVMFAIYFSIGSILISSFFVQSQDFFLRLAEQPFGTWLSFSIRRVNLSFDDPGILEEDFLDPSVRVIFVIGLTIIIALFFRTQAINIEIGALKTKEFVGATALLVGILCGIAERALATAISGRAAAFVRTVSAGN